MIASFRSRKEQWLFQFQLLQRGLKNNYSMTGVDSNHYNPLTIPN